MIRIASGAGRKRRLPVLKLVLLAVLMLLTSSMPSAVPPPSGVTVALPGHAYLHMLALPLGRLEGTIRGAVAFDRSGTRAAFIAVFPGATLSGDWRTLDPVQAFVVDAGRRTLTQLTIDGAARAVSWESDRTVVVWDGDRKNRFAVDPASIGPPPLRMTDPDRMTAASVVAEGGDGRFLVAETAGGRYAVEQVGARTLRSHGTADNGAYAVVGSFLAWADTTAKAGADISHQGATDLAPPSFSGSAYGDAIAPILPLGHAVYQGAYRNGTAYFAFTYGVRRIVAQTNDLLTYSFPRVPPDLSYSVGDAVGADPNGQLYFGRPESDEVTFWRGGRYQQAALSFPSQAGSESALEWAMQRVAPGDPLWPALRPDEDALDNALLQWRMYPVGDAIGERWIASYLGRVMIGDASGRFRFTGAPQSPFAVLGRTDDGRLWGASPQFRYFSQSIFSDASSTLWWSRDGKGWLLAGTVPGDAGAVGLDHRRVWVALTHPWLGRSAIFVMPLGSTGAAITGGSYDGEQLFFAALPVGFYLVWGATPGKRQNGDQGTLSAYRIDESVLYGDAGSGLNAFGQGIYAPAGDATLGPPAYDVRDGLAFVQPSLDTIAALPAAAHATLVTNVDAVTVDPSRTTLMSFPQEHAFEIKYAMRPFPLASVRVIENGDAALVVRAFATGPLAMRVAREHWQEVGGHWQRITSAGAGGTQAPRPSAISAWAQVRARRP
ncbi:MAG: hypothetical protein JO098_04485 [Candidatus Eremiobacteraeota bacterium]|nr:hypothetical protein [Candidatus Eremiobacteraeota bacterium]